MTRRPDNLARGTAAAVGVAFSALLKFSGVLTPGWFSSVVTWTPAVAALLVLVWDIWVWKLPKVLPFHHRPRIDGLWEGSVLPAAGTGRGDVNSIRCFVVIKQSFWSLHVYLCTEESTSMSRAANLCPNEAAGSSELVYVYDNEPQASVLDRSPRHFGTARLLCAGSEPTQIEGSYFTQRLTRGDMILRLVDRSADSLTFTECVQKVDARG